MKRDGKGRFVSEKAGNNSGEEKVYAVGFKGFEPGLICRGKQYAENTVFEEPEAELCKKGMHFCENPLDVFRYYAPAQNGKITEFATVEALAPCEGDGDKKVTTKLRIGAKLTLGGLIDAAVKFCFERVKWLKKAQSHGDYSAAQTHGWGSAAQTHGWGSAAQTHGERSAAQTHGERSAAQSHGDYSAAQTHGERSAAQTHGERSAAQTHGWRSAAQTHGERSAAQSHGDYSAAQTHGWGSAAQTHGERSAAQTHGWGSAAQTHGWGSAAQTHGDYSAASATGKESFAVATGRESKVKGALGCFIACAEWREIDGNFHPVALVSGKVDGKKLKADTWYTVKNGRFVEVEE